MRIYPLPPTFPVSPHYNTYFGKIVLLWSFEFTVELSCGYWLSCWFRRNHPSQVVFRDLIRNRDRASARKEMIRHFWMWVFNSCLEPGEQQRIWVVARDVTLSFKASHGLPEGLRLDIEPLTHGDITQRWDFLRSTQPLLDRAIKRRPLLT